MCNHVWLFFVKCIPISSVMQYVIESPYSAWVKYLKGFWVDCVCRFSISPGLLTTVCASLFHNQPWFVGHYIAPIDEWFIFYKLQRRSQNLYARKTGGSIYHKYLAIRSTPASSCIATPKLISNSQCKFLYKTVLRCAKLFYWPAFTYSIVTKKCKNNLVGVTTLITGESTYTCTISIVCYCLVAVGNTYMYSWQLWDDQSYLSKKDNANVAGL